MKRFTYDIAAIVVSSIIVNWLLGAWDTVSLYPPRMSTPVSPITMMPTVVPLYTLTPIRAATPTPMPAPTPLAGTAPVAGTQVIYVFNLAPMRVWFNKSDAIGYREAQLNGAPTREFISLEKSRTIRGGRMFVLKQEDDLIMVKVEGAEIVGWIQ